MYLVQIGKGKKGAYKTRYSLEKLTAAQFWYMGINIGFDYKKRLIDSETNKVLARYKGDWV